MLEWLASFRSPASPALLPHPLPPPTSSPYSLAHFARPTHLFGIRADDLRSPVEILAAHAPAEFVVLVLAPRRRIAVARADHPFARECAEVEDIVQRSAGGRGGVVCAVGGGRGGWEGGQAGVSLVARVCGAGAGGWPVCVLLARASRQAGQHARYWAADGGAPVVVPLQRGRQGVPEALAHNLRAKASEDRHDRGLRGGGRGGGVVDGVLPGCGRQGPSPIGGRVDGVQ